MIVDRGSSSRADFVEFPRQAIEQSVIDRFEVQVRLYPDHVAIKHDGASLTYRELNERANRIAHAILNHRVLQQAAPVALLLEHTIAIVAATLGTLKAGDFYVVLDPADPVGRVRTLLEDSRAELVLCAPSTRALAHEVCSNATILDVEELERSNALSSANPDRRLGPDALLNIMYTSGSTGRPKGVLQTHRNVLHAVHATTNRLHYSADDRMGILSPLGVGVGAAMLFGGLLIGATVLPFSVRRHGVARMVEWLVDERITSSYSLPSVMRSALSLLPPGRQLPDLRSVRMGGEPVFRSDLPLLRDHLVPGSSVQLTLGTTETYAITWAHIDLWSEPSTPVLPLGQPFPDRNVTLIDNSGQSVAPGEVGEIVVRSQFLSPGYWHQPEATRAAFSELADGAREYRTGDLGRLLPDGNLLHLGRKDFVAKIRGHLVAPIEVETALRELESVSNAAVVTRTESARTRLVAYVVPRAGNAASPRELRDRLAMTLPEYMIPSEYIFLEQLPLLPNGKVDVARLPAAETAATERFLPYAAPRTPIESLLVEIWSELLDRQVGIDDDFIELGGDSLLAAQMLARVNTACQVELPYSALFDAPTVAALASVVTEHLTRGTDDADLAGLLDEIENMPESEAERHAQRLR
jgi:amino acid adenylation domain-containing protein